MEQLLYEPLKYYLQQGRHEHKANVEGFFDELHRKSGVDEQQNKKTVAKYKAKQAEIEKAEKKSFWYKALRIFLIILAVVGAGLLFYGFSAAVLYAIIGGVLVVGSLCLNFLWLNKRIKHLSELLKKLRDEAAVIKDTAIAEMAPLNALFSDRDTFDLIEKTLPEMKFNVNFDLQKEREYLEFGGKTPEYDINRSTLDVLSGNFNGNPFVYEKSLIHRMGTESYTGYLTIHWTETYTDSKGNRQTRTRSQTLHATVVKPKPFYSEDTVLKYVAQGAPELSFTREGMYHDDKSERQIERIVKKGAKKLKKQQEKALEQGKNFIEMTNTEFEVLFGALNRDHEVQFRMMFTPLAQNNMVDLMRSEEGYGDDFDFYKQKRVNLIHTDHAQRWKMDTSASDYQTFDFEETKKKFISQNEEYFKSVFFDFAPLFAIPMYLDKPVKSLEPLKEYKCKYTSQEYESLANRMPTSLLSAAGTATRAIIKTGGVETAGESDRVSLTAYSYTAHDRIDYVPRMGGDGKTHLVPVPWVEYIPVEHTSSIDVYSLGEGGIAESESYCHGLGARIAE